MTWVAALVATALVVASVALEDVLVRLSKRDGPNDDWCAAAHV